jgi:hypothetical protein
MKKLIKKIKQSFCKHTIQQAGGGSNKDGCYTSWICTKCYLNMREEGIDRGTNCQ